MRAGRVSVPGMPLGMRRSRPSQLLGAGVVEGAVVGGHGVDGAVGQGAPEIGGIFRRAEGRRADKLGAFESGELIFVVIQQ
jgi:hypothetical protein